MSISPRIRAAANAAFIHLLCSMGIAVLAAILVFAVWYPYPYRELSGGRELFLLVMAVDVVCGPLLTAVLFNPAKPRAELVRDLALVVAIQLAALAYGLYSVALARPVHLVFEVDRMRAVTVADVQPADLAKANAPWNTLPWTGPTVIGARGPKDLAEKNEDLDLSLQGNERSQRPHWWQDFALSRDAALARAKPVSLLRGKHPLQAELIDQAIRDSGHAEAALKWLPLTSSRSLDWVVLIDGKTAIPVAYLPLDGFE